MSKAADDMMLEEHLKEVRQIGKKSWLVVSMHKSDIEPYRDEEGVPQSWKPPDFQVTPRNRVMLMVDGFTQIDFEVLDTNHLKVICNGFTIPSRIGSATLEDKAFFGPEWANDQVVKWDDLKRTIKTYCDLSNERVRNVNTE